MKILVIGCLIFLVGCAANVTYYSDPPGALINWTDSNGRYGQKQAPVLLEHPSTDAYKNGGCMTIKSPTATWPDGVTTKPVLLELCREKNRSNMWTYVFQKPTVTNFSGSTPPTTQQRSNSASDMEGAKKKCADLGFKTGTESFGNCVLKLSK